MIQSILAALGALKGGKKELKELIPQKKKIEPSPLQDILKMAQQRTGQGRMQAFLNMIRNR